MFQALTISFMLFGFIASSILLVQSGSLQEAPGGNIALENVNQKTTVNQYACYIVIMFIVQNIMLEVSQNICMKHPSAWRDG